MNALWLIEKARTRSDAEIPRLVRVRPKDWQDTRAARSLEKFINWLIAKELTRITVLYGVRFRPGRWK